MSPAGPEAYAWPDYTDLVGRIRELEATLSRVRLVAEDHRGTLAGMDLEDALDGTLELSDERE